MPAPPGPVHRWIGHLCRTAAALAALLLLACLGLVVVSVAMRYLFHAPLPWADELTGWLLVALVMLAAPEVQRRGEHVRIDLLDGVAGQRSRRLLAGLARLACLLAGLGLLLGGIDSVRFTHALGIIAPGWLGVPAWLPQLLIPVGGALLALAAIGGTSGPVARTDPPASDGDGQRR